VHSARKLALFVAGSLVGLGLLEGLLRIWLAVAPTPADSAYLPDPDCGYRLRPHPEEVRRKNPDDFINSFGYRDREHSVQKPPGTWRVLGIGDSFVYGAVPPRDNFLRVAERYLAAAGTADSLQPEMVMAGIGAYSTENELGVMQSLGSRLDVDAAVLCFFIGNDVTGIPLRGKVLRGNLYWTGAATPLHDLLRKSYAYSLTEMFLTMRVKWPLQKALAARRASRVASPSEHIASTEAPTPPLNNVYLEFSSRRLPVYLRQPGGRLQRLWRDAETAVAAFDSTCKAAAVPWVLLLIPDEVQVDPDVQAAVLRSLHKSPDEYDFELPQRRLREFAAARGIAVLDLLPPLRAEHRPDARLYIPNDTHWNALGNRVAGRCLGEYLVGLRVQRRP
jgi:hypothetical protein